jgi:hypothetical protein
MGMKPAPPPRNLGEESGLREFQNRLFTKIFRLKRDEMTRQEGGENCKTGGLYKFYCSL